MPNLSQKVRIALLLSLKDYVVLGILTRQGHPFHPESRRRSVVSSEPDSHAARGRLGGTFSSARDRSTCST